MVTAAYRAPIESLSYGTGCDALGREGAEMARTPTKRAGKGFTTRLHMRRMRRHNQGHNRMHVCMHTLEHDLEDAHAGDHSNDNTGLVH